MTALIIDFKDFKENGTNIYDLVQKLINTVKILNDNQKEIITRLQKLEDKHPELSAKEQLAEMLE